MKHLFYAHYAKNFVFSLNPYDNPRTQVGLLLFSCWRSPVGDLQHALRGSGGAGT